MQSLTFHGDAFSEYYLTRLLWDEPKLKPLLGADSLAATHRRAVAELQRGRRALQARQQGKSTRTLLLNPLAALLGWTLGEPETVQTDEGAEDSGQALTIDGQTLARVLALAPDSPLDLPSMGMHRRFAPTLSLVRALEAQNLNWGILVNAHELRLIRRAEGFVASYIGFDLSCIAEGTRDGFDAWRLLWALLREEALALTPPVLDRALAIGREHQDGVGTALGRQVEGAVVGFLQRIASHPANAGKLPQPLDEAALRVFYAESLRVLYRVLFSLYAESRGLLPLDLPFYRDSYSVTRLARRMTDPETDPRRHPTPSGRYWEHSLRATFALLRDGVNLGPEGGIPKYDGALFDPSRTAAIDALVWGDEAVADLLERLTLVPVAGNRGMVRLSYRELDVEQLGAVYENLLEQTAQFAAEPLYRVALDNRELVLNAAERERLARGRGEVAAGAVVVAQEEEEDDAAVVPPEEGDEAEEADEPAPVGVRKPLQVRQEIPAGTVYLRAGLGRKQTGSFYTSRPLVEFLVRQVVDPLATGKKPEEILRLRVADPAMGSGHFLVGACRRLAEHLLAAYRAAYEDALAAKPDAPPSDLFAEAGIHPEVARNWEYEDRALTACRLLVAGNCLYGVDKNPLAVDLARVSLWLATAAGDHPLTFLDHRLRRGDSLLGYPLWLGGEGAPPTIHLLKPKSPALRPRKCKGKMQGEMDLPQFAGMTEEQLVGATTRQLRERMRRAMAALKTIREIADERPGDFVGARRAFDAMQSELAPFWGLHELRFGQRFVPAETPVQLAVVDQWLAETATLGQPEAETRRVAEPARAAGEEMGAFCWPLAFPEVFFDADGRWRPDAGFDAILGNPPWDKIKPNERECFSDFDPGVWEVQGQARKRLIERLRRENPAADAAWRRHEAETSTLADILLTGGLYVHQIAVVEGKKTGGDPDLFKFFVERAWQLVRQDGRVGLIVPLGLQGSLSTTALRRMLLDHARLAVLCKLDNERYIFPGVFHGQKFDVFVFAKGGRTEQFDAAFFSWEPADVLRRLQTDPRRVTVDAALYRELSPEQYTFVELHDQREADLLRRIYRAHPRLGERREDTWNVSFVREFDMTNDSFLFRDSARLREMGGTVHGRFPSPTDDARGAPFARDEGGLHWTTPEAAWYEAQGGRFARIERHVDSKGRPHLPGELAEERIAHRMTGFVPVAEADDPNALPVRPGEKYVPLYEGRMVHQFDHCQKAYVSGSGRRAKWVELGWHEKMIVPHYFVSVSEATGMQAGTPAFRAGFCDVTGQTNERTVLATVVPARHLSITHKSPCPKRSASRRLDRPAASNLSTT